MRMFRWFWLAALLVSACGGSPTAPSGTITPPPQPIIQPDPTQFDATFNAQLVHDALDHPGANTRARLLAVNPSIYLQRAGLSDETVAAIESEARAVVPMFTGGKLSVAAFEAGADARTPQFGWIVVDLVNDASASWCGLTDVGAPAGHIRLNLAASHTNGQVCARPLQNTFGHELGHALGFYHVADHLALMSTTRPASHDGAPSDKERYHAALAYETNGAYLTR